MTAECRFLDLSLTEREKYGSIIEQSKVAIDDAVSRKETGRAYNSILQAILKLRLFCNHGTFEQPPVSNSEEPELDETLALFQQSGDTACVYCGCEIVSLDGIEDGSSGFLTVCSHLLCSGCLPQYEGSLTKFKRSNKLQCPICQSVIGPKFFVEKDKNHSGYTDSKLCIPRTPVGGEHEAHSTKILELVRDIQLNMQGAKRYKC